MLGRNPPAPLGGGRGTGGKRHRLLFPPLMEVSVLWPEPSSVPWGSGRGVAGRDKVELVGGERGNRSVRTQAAVCPSNAFQRRVCVRGDGGQESVCIGAATSRCLTGLSEAQIDQTLFPSAGSNVDCAPGGRQKPPWRSAGGCQFLRHVCGCWSPHSRVWTPASGGHEAGDGCRGFGGSR